MSGVSSEEQEFIRDRGGKTNKDVEEEYLRDKTFKKQGKIQKTPILPRVWGRMRMEKRPLELSIK